MKHRRSVFAVAAALMIASSVAVTVSGCGSDGSLAKDMFDFGDDYYRSVADRYTLNYDEMIYDDFTGGINPSRWVISDSVWDQWSTDQNGPRPQNVFLVDDASNPETHLLLRANGSYYNMEDDNLYTAEEKKQYGDGKTLFTKAQGDGLNTGGCISTVEALGPGRYDVKMKACPRIGALTSMWVYSWFTKDDGSIQQNEVDIEIGLEPDFGQVFFTTWTSPSNNTNMPTPVDFYVNDGDWHIYSFDWVVDAEQPYVDYYVDGVKLLTITSNVPTTNATLNLGIWCPSWAGGGVCDPDNGNVSVDSRMFESDYAEISWWRYIPFEMTNWEQRTVQNRNFADGYVPKTLTSVPTPNKCSNGDFEDENYGAYANPWKDFTVTDKNSESYVENSSTDIIEENGNKCAKIVNGGYLGQYLRGANSGFKYRLTGKFKTEGDAEAAFRFAYMLGYSTASMTSGNKTLKIGTSTEWKDFSIDFTIDKEGVNSIRYYLINNTKSGNCYFDDISITYLGH